MPYLRTYRIFVSHAWHRGEHYSRVVSWLDEARHFSWENLSVPEHNPLIANNSEALAYELRNQMRPADVFLILAGMYAAHSDWIDFELAFARRIGRPILGIRPRGAERMPSAIQDNATAIVNWNSDSIISAVRDYALASG